MAGRAVVRPERAQGPRARRRSLRGVYVPYWTYDSDTATSYAGERGDVYFVTERYTTVENGRTVVRTRQVPRIRWSPASGRTARHFDDVLVGATRTLPRKITDWLAPWDLDNLVPYREDYLAGFSSEVYQVDLDEGFNHAQKLMDDGAVRGNAPRFSNEPARHKLLDLIGDLVLLGADLHADVTSTKGGHALNRALCRVVRDALVGGRASFAEGTGVSPSSGIA